jgi:hypothetical protein
MSDKQFAVDKVNVGFHVAKPLLERIQKRSRVLVIVVRVRPRLWLGAKFIGECRSRLSRRQGDGQAGEPHTQPARDAWAPVVVDDAGHGVTC